MGSGDVGVPVEGRPDRPVRYSRPAPNHLGLEMAVIRVESQGVVKAIRQNLKRKRSAVPRSIAGPDEEGAADPVQPGPVHRGSLLVGK